MPGGDTRYKKEWQCLHIWELGWGFEGMVIVRFGLVQDTGQGKFIRQFC